jgi:hypothetical protein
MHGSLFCVVAVSNLLYCEESNEKMTVNSERVRISKQLVMGYVRILSGHTAGKTKETFVWRAGNPTEIRNGYLSNKNY